MVTLIDGGKFFRLCLPSTCLIPNLADIQKSGALQATLVRRSSSAVLRAGLGGLGCLSRTETKTATQRNGKEFAPQLSACCCCPLKAGGVTVHAT